MLDLRLEKVIVLDDAQELKPGAAYAFSDELTGRQLVAKLISDYDDKNDWMLVAEFKKMALLSAEPQVGTVYFLAKCRRDGIEKSCYVLDYIRGRTLDEILSSEVPITFAESQDYILEIATGLERAHAYGIFHDDLHERNILVDGFGNLRIIDFLWHVFTETAEVRHQRDLQAFKVLVKKIIEKCGLKFKGRLNLLEALCLGVQSFRGLPRKIHALSDITAEYAYLNEASLELLSLFVDIVPESYKLTEGYIENPLDVPQQILDLCPQLRQPAPQIVPFRPDPFGKLSRPPDIDMNVLTLNSEIESRFRRTFLELERVGLVSFSCWVKGGDANMQWPPYTYGFQIGFTPKFMRWREVLTTCGMPLVSCKRAISDIVFSLI